MKWDEKIATIYFRELGKVAKLGRVIALWGLMWIEVSNMINLTICNQVLTSLRSKEIKRDKEIKR